MERAVQHQSRNTTWRLMQAKALWQMGRIKEAKLKYREVLAIDPSSSQAWNGLRLLGEKY